MEELDDGISISSTMKDTNVADSETDGESSVVQHHAAKMYLGSFDELKLRHQPPMSRRGSLESIESNTKDSVCMYDEDADETKKPAAVKRSISALPNMIDIYNEESERSNHSRTSRASSSRRASYKSRAPASSLLSNSHDGYGTDDDDEVEMTPRSIRRRESLSRRGSAASAGIGAPPHPGAGNSAAAVVEVMKSPLTVVERRGSNGATPVSNGMVTAARRRGSNNMMASYEIENSSNLNNPNAMAISTRRGSTGQRHPQQLQHPVHYQQQQYLVVDGGHPVPTRRGSTGGGFSRNSRRASRRGSSQNNHNHHHQQHQHHRRGSSGPEFQHQMQRGVPMRTNTMDSMEFSRNGHGNSRRNSNEPHQPEHQQDLSPPTQQLHDHMGSDEPSSRGVARILSGGSMGSRQMDGSIIYEDQIVHSMPPLRSPAPRKGRRESGFSATALNRMNNVQSNEDHEEDDDDSEGDLMAMDYGYTNPYGYSSTDQHGHGGDPTTRRSSAISGISMNAVASRRGSEFSNSSGVLSRRGHNYKSHRRNSYLVRPEAMADPNSQLPTEQILYSTPNLCSDSELEDERNASQSTGMSTFYGYEDCESDGQKSMSSAESRKSRRRNSYLQRPESDPNYAASILESTRMSDRDKSTMLKLSIEEDLTEDEEGLENSTAQMNYEPEILEDSDSLLICRSGYHKNKPASRLHDSQPSIKEVLNEDEQDTTEVQVEEQQAEAIHDETENLPHTVNPAAATSIPATPKTVTAANMDLLPPQPDTVHRTPKMENKTISSTLKAATDMERRSSWSRATPFTTSAYSPLTAEKLREAQREQPAIAMEVIPTHSLRSNRNMNWGEIDLDSSDSESDDELMHRLYEDSPIVQEIDRYKQRARRRESIDRTVVNIDRLPSDSGSSTIRKHKKEPNFTPAKGCSNASDFIVRCFTARLRQGISIVKHNRSRWSKSTVRELFLVDGKTLSWRRTDGEIDKGKRPKLDLTKCREIRHAFTKDPTTRKQTGTQTLRKRCKDGSAGKSFSLIFGKRTLDITALTSDQCKVLLEGFSALCYRLQLEAANDDNSASLCGDSRRNRQNGDSKSIVSDDWASTIYSEVVPTLSTTQPSIRSYGTTQQLESHSPWGL